MLEPIQRLLDAFEQDGIAASSRTEQITAGADFIVERIRAGEAVDLMFVCTHNSRRSQFAHVWAAVAASYFDLPQLHTYSGGTEVTACNERTVASLVRSGFVVDKTGDAVNPIYLVSFAHDRDPIECSSKLYTAPNLQDFAAMMCCSDVDEKCPLVVGATARIPWHYDDPKVADATDQEQNRYDERSRQIGLDMFQMMAMAKARLTEATDVNA